MEGDVNKEETVRMRGVVIVGGLRVGDKVSNLTCCVLLKPCVFVVGVLLLHVG